MEQYDVIRLGLILAQQAEIEGMKAENKIRELNNLSLAYGENEFWSKAEQIRNIAYCHNEQL